MRRVAGILALALAFGARAADWPSQAVTMVVPFAAGGPTDVLARILQPFLAQELGQAVVVENVPGGGGVAGALRVAQAPADSPVFVLGSVGTHAMSQSSHRKPPYSAAADFRPVILLADAPLVLVVRKDLPAIGLREFIAYAKANQAKMQFGSAGVGTSTHVGCVLLNQTLGIDVVHVPYRGGGPATQDLVAGRIDYLCSYVANTVAAAKRGQVKVLATLAASRLAVFQEVPTAEEQGLAGFDISAWSALFLPKGARGAAVARLNAAASRALDAPSVTERFREIGLVAAAPERRTPEYLQRFVGAEIRKWAEPIRRSGAVED
jgi:tripartite-type tricarboxylate transporter receptor subunit TctC